MYMKNRKINTYPGISSYILDEGNPPVNKIQIKNYVLFGIDRTVVNLIETYQQMGEVQMDQR